MRSATPSDEVTGLLRAWRAGEEGAAERLLGVVYAELRRLARAQLRGEARAPTLQPTALVHEAFLRLIGQREVDWRDRSHFFGLAATMMRRVLVDHARARLAAKRAHEPITLGAAELVAESAAPAVEILDLDRALGRLAARHERPARVVELRFFGGMELAEVAEVLGVGERTVDRDWQFARAYLLRALEAGPG